MDHVIVMGNLLDHGEQLLPRLLRQIVLGIVRPIQRRLLHIRQLSGGDQSPVDLLEHAHEFLDAPVHLLRLSGQDLGEGAGVEQLKHRAVAVPHLHDIIGDGRGDAQDQRHLGHFPLVLNILQRVGVLIDLHHVVLVDAVELAVGAAADLLAALDGHHTVGLLHGHHLGKAGHVQDLVDLGADIDDAHGGLGFPNAQQHPQPGAGNVFQFSRVQHEGSLVPLFYLLQNALLHGGGVVGINSSVQLDRHSCSFPFPGIPCTAW